jgi:hypothetical protein
LTGLPESIPYENIKIPPLQKQAIFVRKRKMVNGE